jgi:hypothetical protein
MLFLPNRNSNSSWMKRRQWPIERRCTKYRFEDLNDKRSLASVKHFPSHSGRGHCNHSHDE